MKKAGRPPSRRAARSAKSWGPLRVLDTGPPQNPAPKAARAAWYAEADR